MERNTKQNQEISQLWVQKKIARNNQRVRMKKYRSKGMSKESSSRRESPYGVRLTSSSLENHCFRSDKRVYYFAFGFLCGREKDNIKKFKRINCFLRSMGKEVKWLFKKSPKKVYFLRRTYGLLKKMAKEVLKEQS